MYQARQAANFKFIDLSDSEPESDEDKENNPIAHSQHTYSHKSNRPCTHEDGLKHQHSSIINQARSMMPAKDLMQYSTLSLSDHSVDFENKIASLIHQKEYLVRENNELKQLNRELQKQVSIMTQSSNSFSRQIGQYEDKMSLYEDEVNDLRSKIKSMQTIQKKTVKQYENKLLNYELPGNKHWVDEVGKIHSQLKQKINAIINKFVGEFSKQKMNIKVQEKLSEFIKELVTIEVGNPQAKDIGTPNKFSQRNNSIKPYQSKRISQMATEQTKELTKKDRNISEDYKLLSKSIEKLKHMEKEIDKSSGSYLKRQTEQQVNTVNKSSALDMSSLSNLDRSKSRRKRIFQ